MVVYNIPKNPITERCCSCKSVLSFLIFFSFFLSMCEKRKVRPLPFYLFIFHILERWQNSDGGGSKIHRDHPGRTISNMGDLLFLSFFFFCFVLSRGVYVIEKTVNIPSYILSLCLFFFFFNFRTPNERVRARGKTRSLGILPCIF